MQFEESLGVKVFGVQAISLLPDLLQLVLAALQMHREKSEQTRQPVDLLHRQIAKLLTCESTGSTYGVVDFGVVGVLLLHLLIVLLLLFSLVLIERLQVFPPVVLLHHFIFFEFVVPLFVVVLQVFGGLGLKRKQQVKAAAATLRFKYGELVLEDLSSNH